MPGPGGKPVYNFRSDGREFSSGRCLIVADGFYEWRQDGNRQPYCVRLSDASPFAFAAISS